MRHCLVITIVADLVEVMALVVPQASMAGIILGAISVILEHTIQRTAGLRVTHHQKLPSDQGAEPTMNDQGQLAASLSVGIVENPRIRSPTVSLKKKGDGARMNARKKARPEANTVEAEAGNGH
jgi:hypothetical protein